MSNDIIKFSEKVLNMDLSPHQKMILKDFMLVERLKHIIIPRHSGRQVTLDMIRQVAKELDIDIKEV